LFAISLWFPFIHFKILDLLRRLSSLWPNFIRAQAHLLLYLSPSIKDLFLIWTFKVPLPSLLMVYTCKCLYNYTVLLFWHLCYNNIIIMWNTSTTMGEYHYIFIFSCMWCMWVRFNRNSIEDINGRWPSQNIFKNKILTYHIVTYSVTIKPKNPFPIVNVNPITQIKCAQ
jgi:hypothetical protein